MKDSWDKVFLVTPMRAASPPRQMECENEMIVISQPLFCFGASGAAKENA